MNEYSQNRPMEMANRAIGSISGNTTAQRESEIHTEINRLSHAVEGLAERFATLGAKLAPVTRQEPVANEEKIGLGQPNTQLGGLIRNNTVRIQELRMRVDQQIDLTEL